MSAQNPVASGNNHEHESNLAPDQPEITHGLLHEIRCYPKIVAYSFGLALNFLLTGYDTVILGTITAVPYFKREFGQVYDDAYIIPAAWLSVWSAMAPIGSMLGAAAAGWLQDRLGRRMSLALSSVICAIGIAIAFCSNLPDGMECRRGAFLVGRLIQGWGVGGAMAGAQTYLSESVPTSLRGSAMALSPTFMLLGELIGAAVIFACEKKDSAAAYLIPFGTQWIFTILPFALAIVMPESPSYLIRTGNYDKAYQAMKSLHTTGIDVTPLLNQMQISIAHEQEVSQELSYLDCFKGINRRRTAVVGFAFMVPSFFGVPLLASASYFMQVVGMDSSLSIIVLILGIVLGLLANAVGIWFMSLMGRRRLMLITLAITTAIWLSMGISGCWSGNVVICGRRSFFLRLRAKTQGIGVFCYMLSNVVFNLVLPYIYNTDAGDLKGKTGFVYAGLCFMTFVITWLIIPEMKGRSALDIDAMFEAKIPCRQFKNWSSEDMPHKEGAV
ncbi:hypothetical protein N7509_001802 [Penicillium cosmopolitanum]|uniref:Major facilitator superfamily (MFS) profile domain-containing protein n=1 Tax=Penicillium cosmopolitanum TaxID=1131564 RepID=A0A9W9W7U6_9EURO|nr:uncharacterized protein N7509_001802 [Penicillium cosmopolitanum]KAJ5407919.1 hypothetical protein N7509_001802 [Penicillium cosmopolitanum]